MPEQLRIFVSSAGDAAAERQRAQLMIEKLAKSYARFLAIDLVLCDVEPTPTSESVEDQPGPLGRDDVVVLIVSPPLGTSRPGKAEMGRADSVGDSVPATGADAVFEDVQAARNIGGPELLAYRKRAKATASRDDETELAKQQWDSLAAFWSRSFVDLGELGATDAIATSDFADPDGFAAKLESDLRKLIAARIASTAAAGAVKTGATLGLTLGWLVGLTYVFASTPDPLGFMQPVERTPVDAVLLALPAAGAALGAGIGWQRRDSGGLAKLATSLGILPAPIVAPKGPNWTRWGWKIGTVTGLLLASGYISAHSIHGVYLGSITLVFELFAPFCAFLGAAVGWLMTNAAAFDVPNTRE